MTYEDLKFEEKKLGNMLKVIANEKKLRNMAPTIKVFKNINHFINTMDIIVDSDKEDEFSPPNRGFLYASSVVRTLLSPQPSDPTGMPIVASSATAVRIAEVEVEEKEQQIDEEAGI